MKYTFTFKQSQQHPLFYLFILFLFLIALTTGNFIYALYCIPIFIFFFRSYHITPMNTLVGNGTVAIASIERLIVHGIKVTAIYRNVANSKSSAKTFYLKNPEEFVQILTEINPSIEVCDVVPKKK